MFAVCDAARVHCEDAWRGAILFLVNENDLKKKKETKEERRAITGPSASRASVP